MNSSMNAALFWKNVGLFCKRVRALCIFVFTRDKENACSRAHALALSRFPSLSLARSLLTSLFVSLPPSFFSLSVLPDWWAVGVVSHVWIFHVAPINAAFHTNECVMSHVWARQEETRPSWCAEAMPSYCSLGVSGALHFVWHFCVTWRIHLYDI